jgi:nucleoid-associated protein YgaU
MSVAGTIRFLVGAGLIAAGGTLAAPFAARLAEAARNPVAAPVPAVPGGQRPSVGPAAPVGLSAPAAAPVLAVTAPNLAASTEPPGAFAGVAPTDGGDWLQLDRCPPPPPARLPPPPPDLARANPTLGAAYRSTLEVPPPPLLDAAAAPPAVAWPVVAAPAAPAPAPLAELTVPATYRVRDGDDLGSIAGHFYGHPAAASAIWAANRETITHPDLLPIGAELRLPPPWSVRGHGRTVAGAIEPAAHVRPVALDPVGASAPAAVSPPWLAPVTATPVSATPPVVAPAPVDPARSTTVVTLGPGESLSTLARRLYGDPTLADQIFLANRDRLRSPDLAVPGMELRLPRPVTAPGP